MKVCVCVKVVPRQAVALRLDPVTGRLDRSGASEMNPSDEFAVEEAEGETLPELDDPDESDESEESRER